MTPLSDSDMKLDAEVLGFWNCRGRTARDCRFCMIGTLR